MAGFLYRSLAGAGGRLPTGPDVAELPQLILS
jgi:hypothetical protein